MGPRRRLAAARPRFLRAAEPPGLLPATTSPAASVDQRLRATPQRPSRPRPAWGSHAPHERQQSPAERPRRVELSPCGGRRPKGEGSRSTPAAATLPARRPPLPAGKLRDPPGLSRPPASGARKRPHIAGERASRELGARGRLGFWAET